MYDNRRYPATFIITCTFDEFLKEEAKLLGITKSALIEQILRDYIADMKSGSVKPIRYPLLKNGRCFLSVKIDRSLNRELKHLAICNDVSRQDILNCAVDRYIANKKNKKEVMV